MTPPGLGDTVITIRLYHALTCTDAECDRSCRIDDPAWPGGQSIALSDDAANDLERLADVARSALDESRAAGVSVKDAGRPGPEVADALAALRAGYVAHGLPGRLAGEALTVWMIQRLPVQECVAAALEHSWRRAGDEPAKLF